MKVKFFKTSLSILFLIIFIFSSINLYSQKAKIRIIKEEAVLRLKPNDESLAIKQLSLGSELDVVETIGDWIKVKLPPDEDGIIITGYIHSSFVTFDIKSTPSEQYKKPTQPRQIVEPYKDRARPKASFTFGGGISNPVGDGSQYWNTGFSIAMNGFGYLSKNILLGGHVAYHRWTPDENELLTLVPDIGIDWDISGKATILELVPSVRLLALQPNAQSINVFAQVGFGYYFVNLDATIKASYLGMTYQESIEESENKLGVTLGGGIILGRKGGFSLEILPLYRIVFTGDGNTKYFSVSMLFGK